MFKIELLPRLRRGPNGERLGAITIRDFTETFSCNFSDKALNSLEDQWRKELTSLLNGQTTVALVYDPRFAWILYREEERCYVQNRMAIDGDFKNLSTPFDHGRWRPSE